MTELLTMLALPWELTIGVVGVTGGAALVSRRARRLLRYTLLGD